jgi:hypothetical protein
MLHKISDLCNKIDGLKQTSDRLKNAKYGPVKQDIGTINHLIDLIQAEYWKPKPSNTSIGVMSEEEEREWKIMDKQREVQNNFIKKST